MDYLINEESLIMLIIVVLLLSFTVVYAIFFIDKEIGDEDVSMDLIDKDFQKPKKLDTSEKVTSKVSIEVKKSKHERRIEKINQDMYTSGDEMNDEENNSEVNSEIDKTHKLKHSSDSEQFNLIENVDHETVSNESIDSEDKKIDKSLTEDKYLIDSPNWIVVGSSVKGINHLRSESKCQDSCNVKPLNKEWGIVAISDGAGYAKFSRQGAIIATNQAVSIFTKRVSETKWFKKVEFPEDTEWKQISMKSFVDLNDIMQRQVFKFKEKYGDDKASGKVDLTQLACTVIVVLYSKKGILITHVGDGRAGFRDKDGNWKSMMVPWKGKEANSTTFVTKVIDMQIADDLVKSRVVTEDPTAFVLMTDGCEKHIYECSELDARTGEFRDRNKPYRRFLEPLVRQLMKMYTENIRAEEFLIWWDQFIRKGNEGLKNEPDDKTLVVGVLKDL